MKKIYQLAAIALTVTLISCSHPPGTSADGTIVKGSKVFKVIDNELMLIGDLDSPDLLPGAAPKKVTWPNVPLNFIRNGSWAALTGEYRGNALYYELNLVGINDIETMPNGAYISIDLKANNGLTLLRETIDGTKLINEVDTNGKFLMYSYTGKIIVPAGIKPAITGYLIHAALPPVLNK